MTLHLELQDPDDGSYSEVDLAANALFDWKVSVSLKDPMSLTFSAHAPQQDVTVAGLTYDSFIRFWDDDDDTQSSASPLFEGRIVDIDPASDTNKVDFTCVDPSGTNKVQLFSADWQDGVTPGTNAYPRVVYNAKIDNDDDFQYAIANDLTVGEIITDVMDKNRLPLRHLQAAPSGGSPIDTNDMAALNHKPQEKLVFETENPRAAFERILEDWAPAYRLFWQPGSRLWKVYEMRSLPAITMTLNDQTVDHPILAMNIQRSLEGRYSAVKIYGPESSLYRDITLSAGGLKDTSNGPLVETYGAGLQVYGKNRWQITNANERRVLPFLPFQFNAPSIGARVTTSSSEEWLATVETPTRSPTLMVKFPDDNMGDDRWVTVEGFNRNFRDGIIDFGTIYIHRSNPSPPVVGGITQPGWTNPTDVRFVYATPGAPLEVRYPPASETESEAYQGTVYSVAGVTNELRIYDEQLAVYREYYQAVTTQERMAQFTELAKRIWEARSDIVYAGNIVQQGLDYQWRQLGKRLNLNAKDDDGTVADVGFEAINAWVTEVEYDFEADVTTLTLDSDKLDLLGIDVDRMKQDLQIRALKPYMFAESFRNDFSKYTVRSLIRGKVDLSQMTTSVQYQSGFVDTVTGQRSGVFRFSETQAAVKRGG